MGICGSDRFASMTSLSVLHRPGGFRRVVVVTGHMTDAPDRETPRFPQSEVERVRRQVGTTFADWELGPDDLVICGAARGGDLIAARAARESGAAVWVMLAKSPDRFERGSVAGADPAWVDEFWWLLQRVPSWVLDQVPGFDGRDDVYAATNEWMLDIAERQSTGGQLNLLAIWDGRGAAGSGGAGDMVAEAAARGAVIESLDRARDPAAANGDAAAGSGTGGQIGLTTGELSATGPTIACTVAGLPSMVEL